MSLAMFLSAKASTSYKKQNGTLALSRDGKHVSWAPTTPPTSDPYLTIAITDIASEQPLNDLERILITKFYRLATNAGQ